MAEHSGRFVSYGFDTIVASITTDAVAADSITTASISSLEFHVSLSLSLSLSLSQFIDLSIFLVTMVLSTGEGGGG